MSSSVVLAITVLVAAFGLAYVVGRLLTLRSGMLKAAADALVRERLLLPSDAEAYVKAASETPGF